MHNVFHEIFAFDKNQRIDGNTIQEAIDVIIEENSHTYKDVMGN